MKVYLAARYGRLREMQEHRDQLAEIGISVHARWVDGQHEEIDGKATFAQEREFASDDCADLDESNLVIFFSEYPEAGGRARGGRHVEFGMAVERWRHQFREGIEPRVRIFLVGPLENVFHTLPAVERHFEDWASCYHFLLTEQRVRGGK